MTIFCFSSITDKMRTVCRIYKAVLQVLPARQCFSNIRLKVRKLIKP